ncbi:MAG: hypothetical protein CMD23_03340 [Flavobacteriales bacterium]|nr:hypothetical protein [Flavobacteriales bacterium]|tara:strand:- start:510 stop:752 length:243 start_codon:yes stop_codon:yes gene_type:complete
MGTFKDENHKLYKADGIERTPGQRKGFLLAIISILIFALITGLNWNFYVLDMICIIGVILGFSRWLNFITEIFPDTIKED